MIAGARERGAGAEERLPAIFDVFLIQGRDYEGCSFINVLLETGDREASVRYLENVRTIVRTLGR